MQVIDHNPDKTVGVVANVHGVAHIGAFTPECFKEWVQAIEAQFEVDSQSAIHLFSKKADDGKCYAIFASVDGEDPLVVAVAMGGLLPADGKEWGEVYKPKVE